MFKINHLNKMEDKKIAIIGCGNLGEAILKGLVDEANFPNKNIVATKRNIEPIQKYENGGVEVMTDNAKAIAKSELIIVALKPYNILPILSELKSSLIANKHVIVSLATGVSTQEIQEVVGENIAVLRAMPNTAADVNESLTCICAGANSEEHETTVQSLFNLIGETVILDEGLMESATVLGACGIAYVLRFMRAMIQGGIEVGFDAKTATAIVSQTMKGASELIIQNETHPESEIDKVTTPKGCTITGLNEMEHAGFSSALIKGIVASYKKIEK